MLKDKGWWRDEGWKMKDKRKDEGLGVWVSDWLIDE